MDHVSDGAVRRPLMFGELFDEAVADQKLVQPWVTVDENVAQQG